MRDYSKFQRQYRISSNPTLELGKSFLDYEIGTIRLSAHTSLLPVSVVAGGNEVGWLLGEPIDLERKSLVTGTFDIGSVSSLADVNRRLAGLGGWFLAVVNVGGSWIAIPDAAGRMPCCFNNQTGELASSPTLLVSEDEFEKNIDRELLKAVHIDGKGWVPFGLTALPHVRRVLPNHVLEVETLEQTRFWPTSAPKVSAEAHCHVTAIVDATKAALEALTKQGATLALTAGHESRSLLAMLRGKTANITAMTLAGPVQAVDVVVAARVAEMAGVPHRAVPIIASSEQDRHAWMERTGWVVGDENPRLYRTHMSLKLGLPAIGGFGGEVARGFYWRKTDVKNGNITARALMNRMAMPSLPLFEKECQKWLDGVRQFDLFTQLDLAYIEQRLGCWGAPPPFGPDYVFRDFHPMVSRRVFEQMLMLPVDFRRQEKLASAIITQCWPELAQLPFNRLNLFDFYWRRVKKLADPRAVQRKLRKMRG